MAQTTAPAFDSTLGQVGQIADASSRTIDSFAAEGIVPFGVAVQRGTDPDKQAKVFSDGSLLGVSVFSHTEESGQYEDKSSVSVMTHGRVIMSASGIAAIAGDPAYAVPGGAVSSSPNTATISFDADFVASNTIDATINGEAITQITYGTSHEATFDALVAEIEDTIENDLGLERFAVTGDAVARVITIIAEEGITVTGAAVTNGASQATTTVAAVANTSLGGEMLTSGDAGSLVQVSVAL